LLWLCLQRIWPRWRDALVLVQPTTVDRWRRAGFWECWRRRSRRRPGRPRINSDLQALIRRMRAENFLWGAPRIHGELLKLGFTVSERTVSRYLPDRRTRRSQTWRTFLANHTGNLACISTVTASFATSHADLRASVLPCRRVPLSHDGQYASNHWASVDWPPSRQSTSVAWRVVQTQIPRRAGSRFKSGKDPPNYAGRDQVPAASGWTFPMTGTAGSANPRSRPSDPETLSRHR
jgi:hypothetical protein